MTSIHIRGTYADYIEARPCPLINAEVTKALRKRLESGKRPVLVVPVEKPLVDTTCDDALEPRPLPGFEMVADFESMATNDPGCDYSFLKVAWYQDTLFPVIDERTRNTVAKITWFPRASQGSI